MYSIPPCGGWLISPPALVKQLKNSLEEREWISTSVKITPTLPPSTQSHWVIPELIDDDVLYIPINPRGMHELSSNLHALDLLPHPAVILVKERPPSPTSAHSMAGHNMAGHNTAGFADIFCGIGGFRLALTACTPLECVLSCELATTARSLHTLNYPSAQTSPFPNDITRLPSSLLAAVSPQLFVGGFPCQSFSSIGKLEGINNATTGGLFMHILRLLQSTPVPALILENVAGLLTHDCGKTAAFIVESLEGLGYTVHMKLLDASLILPQVRRRVIIVAFRDKEAAKRFTYPDFPDLRRCLEEELEEESELEEGTAYQHLSDRQWSKIQSSAYFKEHPGARRADVTLPAATLNSSYKQGYQLYSQFVPVSGANPRFLTPRECCRLQGFSEGFVLPKGTAARNAFYKCIGNAVPVPVIAGVAKEVMNAIEGEAAGSGVDEIVLGLLKGASKRPEVVERKWREARELEGSGR